MLSFDMGGAPSTLILLIIALALFSSLLQGPLRDVGWRKSVKDDLDIAKAALDVLASEEDRSKARVIASNAVDRALAMSRRSMLALSASRLPYRLPFTFGIVAFAAVLMAWSLLHGSGDPANIPITLLLAIAIGLVLDVTRPGFFPPREKATPESRSNKKQQPPERSTRRQGRRTPGKTVPSKKAPFMPRRLRRQQSDKQPRQHDGKMRVEDSVSHREP